MDLNVDYFTVILHKLLDFKMRLHTLSVRAKHLYALQRLLSAYHPRSAHHALWSVPIFFGFPHQSFQLALRVAHPAVFSDLIHQVVTTIDDGVASQLA